MTRGQFPVTDGSTYILDMTGEDPRLKKRWIFNSFCFKEMRQRWPKWVWLQFFFYLYEDQHMGGSFKISYIESEWTGNLLSLDLSTIFCIPLYLGFGLLRPEEAVFDVLVGYSSNPAERWNLESLFTTRVEVWVRTPICPPYGVIGKMCDVPLSVETATHLKEKEILIKFLKIIFISKN